jgi:hypothetical protein
MLEILLSLDGAARADTSLFVPDAAARPGNSKAKRNLFPAFDKARAHPADTECDSFSPVHDPSLPEFSIACETT